MIESQIMWNLHAVEHHTIEAQSIPETHSIDKYQYTAKLGKIY